MPKYTLPAWDSRQTTLLARSLNYQRKTKRPGSRWQPLRSVDPLHITYRRVYANENSLQTAFPERIERFWCLGEVFSMLHLFKCCARTLEWTMAAADRVTSSPVPHEFTTLPFSALGLAWR